MKNLKLELFNFKKNLSLDQEEISVIIEGHMNACNEHSEKTIINSLNEKLKAYTYDKSVKSLLENLNDDVKAHELLYELKSLYNILNSKNQGELYRQPINVLLEAINVESEQDRMSKVLNELAIYDWVPEIKLFVHNLTKLTIGLGVNGKGIFINEDELNDETTLESLFSSPIVPIVNKNFYPVLLEVSQNMDKFVELDVVKRINNLINPHLECFAFNYKNNTFLYRCDERYGNSFFKYESAIELVNEVKNELNYDLSYFYENKLDKELVIKRKLEDKEREVTLKLEDVQFNIEKVKGSMELLGESEILSTALKNLEKRRANLDAELLGVKELQYKERVKI